MFTLARFMIQIHLCQFFLLSILHKRISRQSRTWDQPLDWCVFFGILRIELIPEGERPLRWDTWVFSVGWSNFRRGNGRILTKKHVLQKEDLWVAISWRSQRSYSELVTYWDEAWIPKIVVRFRTGLHICFPPKTWLAKTSGRWLRSTVKSSKTIRLNLRICFKVFKV